MIFARVLIVLAICLATVVATPANAKFKVTRVLSGVVESDGLGLSSYAVTLVGSYGGRKPKTKVLGRATTDGLGAFQIVYKVPIGLEDEKQPVLYLLAEFGPAMLASAIGQGPVTGPVVVNERTTVATGVAFAQFIRGSRIAGNQYGIINAASMAANLADPSTGEVADVLAGPPNGGATSTLSTFNSLTNVVAACIDNATNCTALFNATAPAGGRPASTVLEALSNLTHNPSYPLDADPIFDLSLENPISGDPVLTAAPTSWLLFLKITGGMYIAQDADNLMDGPGNFAIDERGTVWVNDNYEPELPTDNACSGRRLLKFDPSGASAEGSPFFGGGLSGAGYGITLDPFGDVWVGNFGFEAPDCADPNSPDFDPAPHNSVSQFNPDGTPVSLDSGDFIGENAWPQATISDRKGNIWTANCGNDTVTMIARGDPSRIIVIPLVNIHPEKGDLMRNFGAVVDRKGNVWVSSNISETISVISPKGKLIETIDSVDGDGNQILFRPMGSAVDSQGNVWIANSDRVQVPCPPPAAGDFGPGQNPSVTMFRAIDRKPFPGSPFKGGGVALPWGITVDGDDRVWVFNFGADPLFDFASDTLDPTPLSRFCGIDTSKCPQGAATGDPISPPTGYVSDALDRNTAGMVDPSGNLWVTNNWKLVDIAQNNPGGNSIVVVIGAAGPVQTPIIGPTVGFKN